MGEAYLRYEGKTTTKIMETDLRDVSSVDKDFALGRFENPE